MRAEMRHQRALQDLKQKQLEIQDKQKKYQEMQIKYAISFYLEFTPCDKLRSK